MNTNACAFREREQRALATLAGPWSPTNKKIYSLPPNMTGISSGIAQLYNVYPLKRNGKKLSLLSDETVNSTPL